MLTPTLKQLRTTAEFVHSVLPPTPQICWPLLSRRTSAEVWVKHENHQPVGAFKVRGGLVYMNELKQREPDVSGVIAATRGNHGQSIAFAAQRAGLRAVIVVPHRNSAEKNAAMQALGAELIVEGKATGLADLARRQGLTHRYVKDIFPLAFLAPDAVEHLLNSRDHSHTLKSLIGNVPSKWKEQGVHL